MEKINQNNFTLDWCAVKYSFGQRLNNVLQFVQLCPMINLQSKFSCLFRAH